VADQDYEIPLVHLATTQGEIALMVGKVEVRTWPRSEENQREATILMGSVKLAIRVGIAQALERLFNGR
jgi:hypothetical protein